MTSKRINDGKRFVCPECGKAMRFDSEHGVPCSEDEACYLCFDCDFCCIVNEKTGETKWFENGVETQIPF